MNFTFGITDFEGAEDHLRLPAELHPDHLISINSSIYRVPRGREKYAGNLLALMFDDIIWQPGSQSRYVPPNKEHVQEIIEYGEKIDSGHLVVHCYAGISRSTAATLIVLATHSKPSDASELYEKVVLNRSVARPNDLMLELADEILGWDGELAALGGWQRHRRDFLYPSTGTEGVR